MREHRKFGRTSTAICLTAIVFAFSLPSMSAIAAPKDGTKGPPSKGPGDPSTSPVVLTAPYADAGRWASCTRDLMPALGENCWPHSPSVAETGVAWSNAEVQSPRWGAAPQVQTNTAEARNYVRADTTLSSPTQALPVHVTFGVSVAEVSVQGTSLPDVSTTEAFGGVTVGYAGNITDERVLVDTDPATEHGASFFGDVVISTTIPYAPAGQLSIYAGTAGIATLSAGDIGSVSLNVEAVVKAIQIGGTAPPVDPAPSPSPSPSVSPPTGPATTYTAPFAAEAEAYSGRREVIPSRSGEVQGAITANADTGEVTANLDTIGARVNCTPSLCVGSSELSGSHGGHSSFIFHHSVPTPRAITLTAEWEIDEARVVHAMPCAYGCSYHGIEAILHVDSADDSWRGEWGSESVVPFGMTEIVTVADRTVIVEVTLPDAVGDIRIEAEMRSILSSSIGFSKLDLSGRLKSLTIR